MTAATLLGPSSVRILLESWENQIVMNFIDSLIWTAEHGEITANGSRPHIAV